jgi:hypothetical protein
MQKLHELLARLVEGQVEFVLVGGLAAYAHGSSLITRDLDVCMPMTVENLMRLQAALAGLHPVHKMRPDIPLELTPEKCTGWNNIYLKTDLGEVDCLGNVLAVGDYPEVARESTTIDLPKGPVRIIEIQALIRAKEAMARPRDLEAVRHLRAVLQERAKLSNPPES